MSASASTDPKPRVHPRIHILAAKASPVAVLLRRQPSKLYHVMRWHTRSDTIEYGSWFRGRIYEERCDLSWHGDWMVYMALGSRGKGWSGICRPPRLKTMLDFTGDAWFGGGGLFVEQNRLLAPTCAPRGMEVDGGEPRLPFAIEQPEGQYAQRSQFVARLERDGWRRRGELEGSGHNGIWSWRPSLKHPELRLNDHGSCYGWESFEFELEDSDLLNADVDWATWDAHQQLLVARQGAIERYTLQDLRQQRGPSFRRELGELRPPWADEQPPAK